MSTLIALLVQAMQHGYLHYSTGPYGWVMWVQMSRDVAAGAGWVHNGPVTWFQTR